MNEWVGRLQGQVSRFLSGEGDNALRIVNNLDWSDADLPFGGIKNSGYGRELGSMGIQEFVNKKLVRSGTIAAPV